MATGGNYGVLCGFGLVVVDLDSKEVLEKFAGSLPETFTVPTPGHSGLHLYYLSSLEKSPVLKDQDGRNIGNIQAEGRQVVGPGCIHPNGKRYTIFRDLPLAQIRREELLGIFRDYIVPERTKEEEVTKKHRDNKEVLGFNQEIPIRKVLEAYKIDVSGFKQSDKYLQGPHPVHDSETGVNFRIDIEKNVWTCYRHEHSGGGPLQLVAVLEKIIPCEECVRGALRGELFKRVRDAAISRGLLPEEARLSKAGSQTDQAERLAEYVRDAATLFHDEFNQGYIRCSNSAPAIYRIRSPTFKQWAARNFYEIENRVPNSEAISNAVNVLEGLARFKGPLVKLYNRVAPDPFGDGIWYDLSNLENQAVHITRKGWEIVDDPPILFRRYQHQIPQAKPIHGGSVRDFLAFILPGIRTQNENQDPNIKDITNQEYLILVDLISKFIPEIPHAVLVIYGWHGCAKTYLSRFIKRLIDPSGADTLSLKRNITELQQQISHHYAPNFDNISSISHEQSDELSRAVTGSGSSKRELYSDDEDVIYNYKRVLMINGINEVVEKPDLLDRSLLIEIPNMKPSERKEEKTLNAEFEARRAGILGDIFTVISKSLTTVETLKPIVLPRMDDYTRWCCAISEALGYGSETFLNLYRTNIEKQVEEAIKGSQIGSLLIKYLDDLTVDRRLIDDTLVLETTPTDLLQTLNEQAKEANIDYKHDQYWPKSANTFTRRLRELGSNFLALGYKLTIRKKDRCTRAVRVLKTSSQPSLRVEKPETQTAKASTRDDEGDDSETISEDQENIVSNTVSGGSLEDVGPKSVSAIGDDGDDERGTLTGASQIEDYLRELPSHGEGFDSICQRFRISRVQLNALIRKSKFLQTVLGGQVLKYVEPRQMKQGLPTPRSVTSVTSITETEKVTQVMNVQMGTPIPDSSSLVHKCGKVIVWPPADCKGDIVMEVCPGCQQPYVLRRAYPDGWKLIREET